MDIHTHDHGSKSIQKCDHENDNSYAVSKLQQTAKSDRPTKITDLNDDCLVKIFDGLDLRILFNVAIANEWLRPAVRIVYEHRFGTKNVHISLNKSNSELLQDIDGHVFVSGLKMCLQYLRCFGPAMSNLYISYDGCSNKECEYIDQYVNDYCTTSLVKICFLSKPAFTIGCQPFVRTVRILYGNLGDQFPSLAQRVPNIRAFHLIKVCIDERYIEIPFDHFEDLSNNVDRNDVRLITYDHLITLLGKCRQLQSLEIVFHDRKPLNALLNFIKDNPMIRNLTVSMNDYSMAVILSEINRLVNEHRSLVELNLTGYNFTALYASLLIQQLDSLKKFRFRMDNQLEYDRFVTELDSKWQQHSNVYWAGRIVTVQR